jgi:alpha-D-ribose 1-methylphosphonate 5-triphosphate synthase subunit PhnH
MTALPHSNLAMGLADPVFGSQTVFRTVLTALSEPGKVVTLPDQLSGLPENLSPAAAALLLTLVDYETPTWLSAAFGTIRPWLVFHTGAMIADKPIDARFALIAAGQSDRALTAFNLGDERYPDTSATVIVTCPSLENGLPVTLTGPGVKETMSFAPQGIDGAFWKQVQDNNALFPLGVDLIFVAGSSLAGLPRSTQISGDF